MTTTIPAISPLRQRMIDDMRMRKLADKTQSHYCCNACASGGVSPAPKARCSMAAGCFPG